MESSPPLHVAVLPFLAFGHLLPGLQLAERLASRGVRVSFVSTPRNIARLRRPSAARVDFVELPFPRVDGLPEGAEATTDVPPDKFPLHRKAFDRLSAPFSAFLEAARAAGNKVDWVIVDSFPAARAFDYKVPCVLHLLYPAAWCAHLGAAVLRDGPAAGNPVPSFIARGFVATLDECKLVAVRSCVEFEPDKLPLLPEIFGKPVVPVGLLPPQVDAAYDTAADGDAALTSWLDKQPPRSVVYVALGSEAPVSVELLRELALGLDLSGAPFLWALRKPRGDGGDDVLPPGFEERTRGRGLVETGWVPQIKILAHAAVGAFLTHCGSSSTVEGLLFGHPFVMLPFMLDQITTASYLEETKKVGVRVPRDGKPDGPFDRHGVAGAVRAVLVDEQSRRVFTANAKKLQEVVADAGCNDRCIDALVQQLSSYKEP
ncbi:UDP-glycosyltransferase 91D2-like [Oryza brachyantha]|uniref:UDP-glycosyltransferase 91D2-like n=1 Tax=Oryza brachyantha TaxID=4533 RepID=UPI001ADAD7A5|nr:UDP-glycosyltransferase 91D2-like [Oryza brachyantha]